MRTGARWAASLSRGGQFDWQSPVWSPLFRLACQYKRGGMGLSDRDVPEFSFEAFVRDRTRSRLIVSPLRFLAGSPISIAYAARHPQRVSASSNARAEASITLIHEGWGRTHTADAYFPDRAGPKGQAWPVFSPAVTTVGPHNRNIGINLATFGGSPETITASVPVRAPTGPPLIGASITVMPLAAQAVSISARNGWPCRC
jgi:hypothetical protein